MATAILNPGMGSRLETDKDSRPYISLKRLPDPEVSTGSSKAHVFSQSERPEIGYLPDEQNFQERAARLAAQGDLSADSSRPAGFPERMEGPRVWSGKDLGDEDSYAVHLTPSDIEEVEAALESFKGKEAGPGQVRPSNFPLPTLGEKLREMAKTVYQGRGFVFIRGLDPKKYSSMDNILIFNGITSYISEIHGRQDDYGNMLVHMKDMEAFLKADPLRPTYSQDALPFHNDIAEVAALYGMQAAAEGGDTTFASAATIYNELVDSRPDAIRTLAKPDWKYPEYVTEADSTGWLNRALLLPSKQSPYFFFSRRRLTGIPDFPVPPNLPPMTEMQAEALDLFEYAARKHAITVRFGPGDIFVFHNLSMVHGRTAFRNGSKGSVRHIIRTFLLDEDLSWKVPRHADAWQNIYRDPERLAKAVWRTADDVEVKHMPTPTPTAKCA